MKIRAYDGCSTPSIRARMPSRVHVFASTIGPAGCRKLQMAYRMRCCGRVPDRAGCRSACSSSTSRGIREHGSGGASAVASTPSTNLVAHNVRPYSLGAENGRRVHLDAVQPCNSRGLAATQSHLEAPRTPTLNRGCRARLGYGDARYSSLWLFADVTRMPSRAELQLAGNAAPAIPAKPRLPSRSIGVGRAEVERSGRRERRFGHAEKISTTT